MFGPRRYRSCSGDRWVNPAGNEVAVAVNFLANADTCVVVVVVVVVVVGAGCRREKNLARLVCRGLRGGGGGAGGGSSGGRGGEVVETEAVAVKSAESVHAAAAAVSVIDPQLQGERCSTRLATDTVVTLALAQHCQ